MAELHVGFIVRGNQTVSKIGKKKELAAIIFTNEDKSLSLSLDIREIVLRGATRVRRGRKIRVRSVIPPLGTLKYPVGSLPVGTTLKWTAQIGASNPEDPIIIIER